VHEVLSAESGGTSSAFSRVVIDFDATFIHIQRERSPVVQCAIRWLWRSPFCDTVPNVKRNHLSNESSSGRAYVLPATSPLVGWLGANRGLNRVQFADSAQRCSVDLVPACGKLEARAWID